MGKGGGGRIDAMTMSAGSQLAGHQNCVLRCRLLENRCGEVREWSNRHAWKACVPAMGPWVRIPPSPPFLARQKLHDGRPKGSGAPAVPDGNEVLGS